MLHILVGCFVTYTCRITNAKIECPHRDTPPHQKKKNLLFDYAFLMAVRPLITQQARTNTQTLAPHTTRISQSKTRNVWRQAKRKPRVNKAHYTEHGVQSIETQTSQPTPGKKESRTAGEKKMRQQCLRFTSFFFDARPLTLDFFGMGILSA